ncbi:MAG: adenylyltransferase/cytidyltransferase family protein [Candidatus Hydrothermarchaeota archaeon]
MATGVFDIIHPGHIYYLEEAKKLGDELIVIVARDKTVRNRKREPVIEEKQRLEVVKALKPVDEAFLGSEKDIFDSVKKIRPDIIALGPNQDVNEEWLKKELKKRGFDNIRIERIKKMKVSRLNSSHLIIEEILKKYKGV